MPYRAVGFDWGGVLNGKPGKFFGEAVAKLLGIPHDAYLEAYFHHNKKVNRGEIGWEKLWTLVLTELGQPNKVAPVMKLSEAHSADSLNLNVLDLVDTLKKSGYKVGLLSNNTHEKAAEMRKNGLHTHFDVFHISAETSLVKPEPEAFQYFADALGVTMAELVFIDDAEKSLSTSGACGFTPILFESYEKLIMQLADLKIL
ncbi:MAG: HAD-IA family hydrolase [Candidatus Saccharimonadales bacterium]